MYTLLKSIFGMTLAAAFVAGCQTQSEPVTSTPAPVQGHDESDGHDLDGDAQADQDDADVAAAMATLSPEDRKEAEAQKFCAVMEDNLLGSMGTPLKLDIKGESVFLCCAGCKSKAMKDPDATLATVAKMKAENGAAE